MKRLTFLIIAIVFLAFQSCKKCKDENPRARIINNGTNDASVQIKTSGGNTENINNVPIGTSSDFKSYAPGEITFTIIVNKVSYIKTVNMEKCFEYNIAIDANNSIVSTPTDRND